MGSNSVSNLPKRKRKPNCRVTATHHSFQQSQSEVLSIHFKCCHWYTRKTKAFALLRIKFTSRIIFRELGRTGKRNKIKGWLCFSGNKSSRVAGRSGPKPNDSLLALESSNPIRSNWRWRISHYHGSGKVMTINAAIVHGSRYLRPFKLNFNKGAWHWHF